MSWHVLHRSRADVQALLLCLQPQDKRHVPRPPLVVDFSCPRTVSTSLSSIVSLSRSDSFSGLFDRSVSPPCDLDLPFSFVASPSCFVPLVFVYLMIYFQAVGLATRVRLFMTPQGWRMRASPSKTREGLLLLLRPVVHTMPPPHSL